MPTGYFTDDYFPKVPGPLSATEVPKQMKVLKGYTFRGQKGDLLSAFQVLYPGNMMDHVEKVFARMKQENSNTAALTAGEWLVFLCLLIAATLQKQSGHALWDQAPYRPFSRGHPGFGDYMRRRRFDEIKAACTWAFRDDDKAGTDKWYKFRPAVDAYNANRLRTVHMSEVIVPDEAMSPFRPRTTADGGLAHISFIDRKPKPMGTEFKCVADGHHGLMLYLEIQEGAAAMALKRYRDEVAPASATGIRMALGATGRLYAHREGRFLCCVCFH